MVKTLNKLFRNIKKSKYFKAHQTAGDGQKSSKSLNYWQIQKADEQNALENRSSLSKNAAMYIDLEYMV